MTRSKVSPDGKIAERDVAAKLVIIMVGLPARGKSYITKKIQRYLSWQQHNAKIFNVGNRRRIAAGAGNSVGPTSAHRAKLIDGPTRAASILLNGITTRNVEEPTVLDLNNTEDEGDHMEQSAYFFDPSNQTASQFREKLALGTLDELLDYLLNDHGAAGILDATNSTIERRELLVRRIRQREPKLGILFVESVCTDPEVSCRIISCLWK